ncbi:glycosyltransferase [uncultured Gemmiger sp.]|uniref:glycosyltransferase family 2 protein n=1 Tax=uncultured Gemmiger sp. TaxID=1623490 RepID=UPI0025EA4A6B|nr:glycosyltransferase [uncultured Gemmiger sp.]
MRPAICVVVPVYRAESTIDRCVESILTQQVPGGVCCVLVDDGSPDRSGGLCDAWARRDARVRVLHKEDGGVSSARNAGMAVADAEYLVFLDADDALRPGALAAALAAQRDHPGSFVVWRYSTDPADPAPASPDARVQPASAMVRMYLDCLIAMPWNKLYRADLAAQLRFDESYTLGEDLQFVLDYMAKLQASQPGWQFALVDAPLTFYNCDTTGTSLSTRYHSDYCDIWPQHFAKLNAAGRALHAPAEDLLPLHRAELTVLAEGVADILRRDPASPEQRRAKAARALRTPWLRDLLRTMRAEKNYSPYYLPVWWKNLHWLFAVAESKRTGSPLYGKMDWLGYYLFLGRRRRE